MRQIVLFLLFTSLAAPAGAAQDRDGWAPRFEASSESSDLAGSRPGRSRPSESSTGVSRSTAADRPRLRVGGASNERRGGSRRQADVPLSTGFSLDPPARGEAAPDTPRRRMDRTDSPRRRLGGIRPTPDMPSDTASPSATAERVADTPVVRRSITDSVREWRVEERRRADSPTEIQRRNLRRAPNRPTDIERRNLRRAPVSDAQGSNLVEQGSRGPRVVDGVGRISDTPRPGTQPPARVTRSDRRADTDHRWRHDWRRDGRYDWRDHRRRHRSIFQVGYYYDPFGWGYQRYNIGWRLWPRYYGSSYWLADPWYYRLPPAYGPYRWIRYHDDALLVNIYTGEVVDVIYDFFW